MRQWKVVAALVALVTMSVGAQAQQIGYGSGIFIPVVVESPSYASQIFIHNPQASGVNVRFTYTGGTGSATPGFINCSTIPVLAGNVVKTSLVDVCPSLNPGTNFGVLTGAGGGGITGYTRVQTPAGNGFSVESIVAFDTTCCVSDVIGLSRQAAAPGYQSNCFLYNSDTRSGRILITLAQGDGAPIAVQIVDLLPGEVMRLLDVFAALNAPPGDYANIRARFESVTPFLGGSPVGYVAACTVQNNTSFDADFRIAKFHN